MRAWIAAVAAVGALAGVAACSSKDGPADEALACSTAVHDADAYSGSIMSQLSVALSPDTPLTSTLRYQGIETAQTMISEWQSKIKPLIDMKIKPELQQTLTDGTKMLDEVKDSMALYTAAVPSPAAKFDVFKGTLRRTCA